MAVLIATLIGAEVVREIVHRRGDKATGIGGAQDVLYYALPLKLVLCVVALVALVLHVFSSGGD